MDFDEFAAKMEKAAKSVPLRAGSVIQDIAERVHRTLVVATPVDTGKARSNWLIGLDGDVPDEVVGPVSASEARRIGRESIYAEKAPEAIAIVNNVPYIGKLNAGSSQQAPAGFVEAAFAAGERAAREANLLED